MVENSGSSRTTEPRSRRVLVVEDDEGLNQLAQNALRAAGYDAEGVSNGEAAIERIIADPDRVMLLDIRLPDMVEGELIGALAGRDCLVPFIVMTGNGDERTAVEMMKLGAADYLVKGLDLMERLPGAFGRLFRELDGEQRLRSAEETLHETEEQFRRGVVDAPVPIMIHADDGEVVLINKVWTRVTGYTHGDIPTIVEWTAKAYGQRMGDVRSVIDAIFLRNAVSHDGEFEIRTKSGQTRTWDFSSGPLGSLPDGRRLVISTAADITERKRAEQALMRQQRAIALNNRIATVFLTSPSEETYADVLDVVLEALDSRIGFFGYIDDAGDLVCPSMTRDVWKRCQIDDRSIVFPRADWGGLWGRSLVEKRTLVANEGLCSPEGHVPLENALVVPIMHHDTLIGQFAVANSPGGYGPEARELLENVSAQTVPVLNAFLEEARQKKEHEKLEKQLAESRRLEAIGRLAGGVAHDFNNQLAGIINCAELLLRGQPDEKGRHYADMILKTAQRSADLTAQLLAFSRKAELRMERVDVHSLVAEVVALLGHTIDRRITIEQCLAADPAATMGDASLLQSALLNLAINARDAMPDGGELVLATDVVTLDEAFCRAHPQEVTPGRYIRVSVSDTGAGMDQETVARVFEPFFTTKGVGAGTGLGLAAVYGTMRSHGGIVGVRSEPGHGSVFDVHLPLAPSVADSDTEGKRPTTPATEGTARILFVDDEEAVRESSCQALRDRGYDVVSCEHGAAAVEYYRDAWSDVDLVVLDMMMPQMNGPDAFRAMRAVNPRLKALLLSGFSLDNRIQAVLDQGALGYLEKPFRLAELYDKVSEVLGMEIGTDRVAGS